MSNVLKYKEMDWVVDIDSNTENEELIVTIKNELFYIDFWCSSEKTYFDAISWLETARSERDIVIGDFNGCSVLMSRRGFKYAIQVSKQDQCVLS